MPRAPRSTRPPLVASFLLCCLTSAVGAQAPAPAAPANPFLISPGPYRAVRVSYASTGGNAIGESSVAMDLLVAPGAMASRSTVTATVNGRATSQRVHRLLTADSTWEDGVAAAARVRPAARGALAREFDALDAAGKWRVVENLRRLPRGAIQELGVLPSAIGTRRGASSVAGQPCDEYELFGDVVCVLPRAPAVPLRMAAKGQAQVLAATTIVLDADVAPAELRPAAGRQWARGGGCECTWMASVWTRAHEDAEAPPLRELARFTMKWLASPDAARALAEATEEARP